MSVVTVSGTESGVVVVQPSSMWARPSAMTIGQRTITIITMPMSRGTQMMSRRPLAIIHWLQVKMIRQIMRLTKIVRLRMGPQTLMLQEGVLQEGMPLEVTTGLGPEVAIGSAVTAVEAGETAAVTAVDVAAEAAAVVAVVVDAVETDNSITRP